MPSIRFDGTDDFLVFTALSLSSDFTIIAITKNVSVDSIVMGHSTLNRQIRIFQSASNCLTMYDGTNNPISATFTNSASGARMNVWQRSGSTAKFFENNAIDKSSGSMGSTTLEWIGKYSVAVLYLNADLGELVIYNSALTSLQIQDLFTNYFQPKYTL